MYRLSVVHPLHGGGHYYRCAAPSDEVHFASFWHPAALVLWRCRAGCVHATDSASYEGIKKKRFSSLHPHYNTRRVIEAIRASAAFFKRFGKPRQDRAKLDEPRIDEGSNREI
eukprot:GHVU01035467.1.p5 GENE.GHVU01035467.1~~GHVU01035467.1.p5  ORF type:complete len:113 (+),score=5.25 GHVU01035467.1:1453-1791(+)